MATAKPIPPDDNEVDLLTKKQSPPIPLDRMIQAYHFVKATIPGRDYDFFEIIRDAIKIKCDLERIAEAHPTSNSTWDALIERVGVQISSMIDSEANGDWVNPFDLSFTLSNQKKPESICLPYKVMLSIAGPDKNWGDGPIPQRAWADTMVCEAHNFRCSASQSQGDNTD
jgi:hypothetical protein